MKVLCGTDFSKPARAAAEVAAYLAANLALPLRLVHCVADWLAPVDFPACDVLHVTGQELLDAEADRICAPGQCVETRVLHGDAGHHLVVEGNHDTAMVVIGSSGKGLATRLLTGSVADHVAETVGAPTLVVRHEEPLLQWLQNGRTLKVLCASEISESGQALTSAVAGLLLLGPLDLECAHLVQAATAQTADAECAGAARQLFAPSSAETAAIQDCIKSQFHESIGLEPCVVHVRSSLGNPAYDLVSLSLEMKADLIVVGSHHKHGLQRLRHPSFSRRVLAHARTNVLCVYLGGAGIEPKVPATRKRDAQEAGVSAVA